MEGDEKISDRQTKFIVVEPLELRESEIKSRQKIIAFLAALPAILAGVTVVGGCNKRN